MTPLTSWYAGAALAAWLVASGPGVVCVTVVAFWVWYARLVRAGLGHD